MSQKHQLDDRFTLVAESKYLELLKYLLSNYVGLYEQVAPEGFESSVYHSIYSTTMQQAYRNYRELRALGYKHNRLTHRGLDGKLVKPKIGDPDVWSHELDPYRIPGLLSYEQFAKTHQLNNPDPNLAAFKVYLSCITDLLDYNMIIYEANFQSYKSYTRTFEEDLLGATLEVLPEYEIVFDDTRCDFTLHGYRVDCTPIYEYIFILLQKRGIDCMYPILGKNENHGLFDALEKMLLDAEADRILITDYGDREIDAVEAERRERMKGKAEANEASYKEAKIEAYHNVYGKLMENYPYDWM